MNTPASARAARLAYTCAWYLMLPGVAAYLLWRSLRQREYRQGWAERFLGRGARPRPDAPTIWIHAVSVGETRAAQPLIEQLATRFPQAQFVITHMTPTGRAVGAALAAALPQRVVQRYLPYDLPHAVARFLREASPRIGIIMETEVWPNLLHAARARCVPILAANARLSEKSAARAQQLALLIRPAAAAFTRIAAQSQSDAERFARFYSGPIDVLGNLKFDLTPDPHLLGQADALRSRWNAVRVGLLASSREGEEALVLDAFEACRRRGDADGFRLIIVPRHPQRFEEVASLIAARGLRCARRSRGEFDAPGDDAILLGDTMGEMPFYYRLADAAVIGGSLLPFGAQNLIEACAVGTPVILGPSTYNFAQAAQDAVSAGAALQVVDAGAAMAMLLRISRDANWHAALQAAARGFAQAHGGATGRTVSLIREILAAEAGAPAPLRRPAN